MVNARVGINSYKVTHMATGKPVKFVINGRRMTPFRADDDPIILKRKTTAVSDEWIDITGMESSISYIPPSRRFQIRRTQPNIRTSEVDRLVAESNKFLERTRRKATGTGVTKTRSRRVK